MKRFASGFLSCCCLTGLGPKILVYSVVSITEIKWQLSSVYSLHFFLFYPIFLPFMLNKDIVPTCMRCPSGRNLWSLCRRREYQGMIHRWDVAWWQVVTCLLDRRVAPSQTCTLPRPLDYCHLSAGDGLTPWHTSGPAMHNKVLVLEWVGFNAPPDTV